MFGHDVIGMNSLVVVNKLAMSDSDDHELTVKGYFGFSLVRYLHAGRS